jgi:hypothetical protein
MAISGYARFSAMRQAEEGGSLGVQKRTNSSHGERGDAAKPGMTRTSSGRFPPTTVPTTAIYWASTSSASEPGGMVLLRIAQTAISRKFVNSSCRSR